jgi:RNA polymerase sigma factor (sigma-70 family)
VESPVAPVERQELLVRFSAGERAAFVEVYQFRCHAVRRWVGRFFRRPFDQEEAAQEVWLTVHRMQTRFDLNRGPLISWLRAISANRCRELLRARGRRPDLSIPLEDVDDARWLDEPLEEPVLSSQLRSAFERFRASLPEAEAKVLQHAFLEDCSIDELASRLGMTARQSKYIKKKLLERAMNDEHLRRLAREICE